MVTTSVALTLTILTVVVFSVLGILHARGRIKSLDDYFTVRNTNRVGVTTATLIASGMGAWILFSPAETAVYTGVSGLLGYAVGSALPLAAFIILAPRIRTLLPQGHTLTEFALSRYGRAMYGFVLLVSVFYMFIFLAAEMTGIAGALGLVAGVPAWQTALVIGAFVVAYTAYGGLKASIFTDTAQLLVILPLLALGFAAAIWSLGGTDAIYAEVVAAQPELLDPGFGPGLQFGLLLVVAILAAEMMNQSWWQRLYAARDNATVRRGFAASALAVFPMILLAGLFGLVAAGKGLVADDYSNASIAFFSVVNDALPAWFGLIVVLLAVMLVMSTADTLLNALSSVVTGDLPRFRPETNRRTLLLGARLFTILIAAAATFIGAQGYSVLQLFLIADLLAAAVFFPLLFGLWSRRASQGAVLTSSVAGLLVGAAYYPLWHDALTALPVFGGLLPAASDLNAFLGAFLASALLSIVLSAALPARFDHATLAAPRHRRARTPPDAARADRPEVSP